MGSNSLRQLGRSVITRSVQIAVDGRGKLDLLDAAADAFGNALGGSIREDMKAKAAAPAKMYAAANSRWRYAVAATGLADDPSMSTDLSLRDRTMFGAAAAQAVEDAYVGGGVSVEVISQGEYAWDPVDELGPEYQFDNMLAEQRAAGSGQNTDIWSEVGATISNGFAQFVGNAFSNTVNGTADWAERFVHAQPGEFGRMELVVSSRNEVADEIARDFAAVTAGIALWAPVAKVGRASGAVTNSAVRAEAAANVRQARDILRETRPDLTVSERNQIIKACDLESFRVNTLSSPVTEFRYFDGLEGGAGLSGRWSTSQWFDIPAERRCCTNARSL